eukprot:jgi/Mesen1/1605/ME000134S00726
MALSDVISRFAMTSALMWIVPIAILYAFNNNLLPVIKSLSPEYQTLWGGLFAVAGVNVVIAIYIILALRDPPSAPEPQPDPVWAAKARAELAPASGVDETSTQADSSLQDQGVESKGKLEKKED